MTLSSQDQVAIETLESRLKTILPEQYQDHYDELDPTSMGSAGLRLDAEGRVAWNEIWGGFCDLAMAGGPPHKGRLLAAASLAEIEAHPALYREVYEEIGRGIRLVTGLQIELPPAPGWIRIHCAHSGMAGWLVRAITMENVSVRSFGPMLDLPVGPHYRLQKEIKNVVTVIAKTCHYWTHHIQPTQQRMIANLLARLEIAFPLLRPCETDIPIPSHLCDDIARYVTLHTQFSVEAPKYHGWLGVLTPDVHTAIWLMRAVVTKNVLSRREDATLYLAIDPERDIQGSYLTESLCQAHRMHKVSSQRKGSEKSKQS